MSSQVGRTAAFALSKAGRRAATAPAVASDKASVTTAALRCWPTLGPQRAAIHTCRAPRHWGDAISAPDEASGGALTPAFFEDDRRAHVAALRAIGERALRAASGGKRLNADLRKDLHLALAVKYAGLGLGRLPKVSIRKPAKLASLVLEELTAARAIVDLEEAEAEAKAQGPAVLTEEQQAELLELAKRRDDSSVVRFLAPHIDRLRQQSFSSSLAHKHEHEREALDPCLGPLVLSLRAHYWPAQRSSAIAKQRSKPDMVCLWRPLIALPLKTALLEDGKHSYGATMDARLLEVGCIQEFFVCSRSLSDDADSTVDRLHGFGVLAAHMHAVDELSCGVVFDAERFWLYRSLNGGLPVKLIKGRWGAAGSAAAIRDFFRNAPTPPLLDILRLLLRRLDLKLCFFPFGRTALEAKAHLGSGTFGHVFAVTDKQGVPRALKVAVGDENLSRAKEEFALLEGAAAKGAPVIKPVPGSLVVYDADDKESSWVGGGYLLEEIGRPHRIASREDLAAAFEALAALHRAGILHRDARLQNLLRCSGSLRWIDLSSGPAPLPSRSNFDGSARYLALMRRHDAAVLARSITGIDPRQQPAGAPLRASLGLDIDGLLLTPSWSWSPAEVAGAAWDMLVAEGSKLKHA